MLRKLAGAVVLLTFPLAVAAAERVLQFHSQIRIEKSGELGVIETIQVEVEGRQIRRGILRDFPTEYRDRAGNLVRVPLEVLSVKRDGRLETFALERMANGTRIRIGDGNVMLPHGPHTYELTYRTGRQVGFFADFDEVYWNVNGNGWTFAFDKLSAEVRLPADPPQHTLKAEAFTGPAGAKGQDYVTLVGEGRAFFRTTRALNAGEGLTLVFSFPKGIVAPPSLQQKVAWFLKDNTATAAGLVGLLALVLFLYWRWTLVGRDPRAGPRFPRYEPPPGIGAAGARFVHKMAYDDKCFAAGLLGLGQRGVLTISERSGDYDIARTGKTVEWLPGEKPLLGLVPAERALHIGKTHDPAVQAARAEVEKLLILHFEPKLFSRNRGSLFAGVALAALTLAAMYGLEAPDVHLGALFAAMAVPLYCFSKWLPAYSVQGRKLEDHIEGLRQYLAVAEADDLRRMKAPPQTKEEFARLLPYAVALDVEKTWAERFAKTLGAAAVTAAVADYYSTDSGGGLFDRDGSRGFASSLSDLGGTISSASTPPGSSSGSSDSGGGGSSGGGGGGGGGSGW